MTPFRVRRGRDNEPGRPTTPHELKIREMLGDIRDHIREDIGKIEEP
jgi:hypothetical protein